ncbi:MAG: histidine--tRNA ligase [Fimbriiglobus sp.]
MIEPRTLKGFRDYPPALMIPRERVLQTARDVYRSYGFAPIDTPAMEYAEVLLGKGGGENDKIVYRFKDHGDRDVALRFDLTVPFARFAAAEVPKLGTPFKRYAMGPVWRGENTGHGRYREFWQCDFDTIGTTANASDIEVALVVNDLFTALGFEDFTIRVNNRMVLNGLLESLNLADKTVPLLRALDKLDKIGREKVIAEMTETAGVTIEQAGKVLLLAETAGGNAEVIDRVDSEYGENGKAAEGVARLRELLDVAAVCGVPEGRIKIDLSIARGLDYYTGTIYETFLGGQATDGKPLAGFGSVCSGGRYDNLASVYTKQVLPGVGASLGVDRLLAAMEAMGHPWLTGQSTPAQVLVVRFDGVPLADTMRLAAELRRGGIATEVYPEPKKLGAQFQYADKRKFRLAVVAGPDDVANGTAQVKNLTTGEQTAVPSAELISRVRAMLDT